MRLEGLFASACLVLCSQIVNGFVVPQSTTTGSHHYYNEQEQERVARAGPLHAFLQPEHVDLAHQFHLLGGSSTLLSDAAAAAAVEAETKLGFWDSYYNLFKTALTTVHSAIDEPLRSGGITQTWGVSIAIFTASIRSLLIPLSIQQNKATEYMKALKPYISEINQKFKNNADAKARATAKLYEDAKQNPLSGCLLSLAQLPVLFGLYRSIRSLAQDGLLKEPFLWIPSLEGPVTAPDFRGMDWLLKDWTPAVDGSFLPTPSLGWETTLAFLVMPVVLVLGQSLTMKVLAPPVDTENMSDEEKEQTEKSQRILKFLPLLIGYFSLQVPAGLTIYWFTSNLFSLTQSLVIKAYYQANPPKIELPDYWDALENLDEMSAEDKRKAAQAGIAVGPKFEDLLEEANFHYLVKRGSLRPESEAWERVTEGTKVPEGFAAWVAAAPPPPPPPPPVVEEASAVTVEGTAAGKMAGAAVA